MNLKFFKIIKYFREQILQYNIPTYLLILKMASTLRNTECDKQFSNIPGMVALKTPAVIVQILLKFTIVT